MQICIIDLNLIFLLTFCIVFLTHILHFLLFSLITFCIFCFIFYGEFCNILLQADIFVIKNMMKTPYLIIWHNGKKYFLKNHCHLLVLRDFKTIFLNFHYTYQFDTYWGISFWYVNCEYLNCCKIPGPIRNYFTLYSYGVSYDLGPNCWRCNFSTHFHQVRF